MNPNDQKILEKTALFRSISPDDLPALLSCLQARERTVEKENFLFLAGESKPMMGVVLSGHAQVIRENILGDRMLIGSLPPGSLFGETYACMDLPVIPVSVVAKEACRVLLLDIQKVLHTCTAACSFHQTLIHNLMKTFAQKNAMLNRKMSYLSHKTIRGRLEAFFLDQAEQKQSPSFSIPFNRNELADYLCTDRSALSRELGNMKQDGLLDFHKNHIRLTGLLG